MPDAAGPSTEASLLGLLDQLRDITQQFAAIEDVDSLVVLVDDLISRTVHIPYYALYLIDPGTGEFRLPLTHGFSEEEAAEAERTAMDRHPGWVLRNREILHVPDVQNDPESRTVSSKRGFTVRSRLWIPVMARDECVGAFGMAHHIPDAFSDIHISLLTFVSNLAGIVYRNLTATEALTNALARAESADRAKTAFLANMSHELRTPMNGVLGAASLLVTTRIDQEQRELISTVQSSARSMVTLVDDLLESSKIDSGQVQLHVEDTAIAPWIDSAVNIILPTVLQRGLKISVKVEPDAPHGVRVDPLRARQILLNLLSNAVKFTEYGGVNIRIYRQDNGQAGIVVQDTGIGIPEDKAHRLFGRFSQVDDSINRRFGGTGLGLVISRQLAEAMGGSLELTSSTPGVGSSFTIGLPIAGVSPPEGLRGLRVRVDVGDSVTHDNLTRACAWLGCVVIRDPDEVVDRCITDDASADGPNVLRIGAGPEVDLRKPLRLARLKSVLLGESDTGEASQVPTSGSGQHVLIVDDNPVNLELARRLVSAMGYRVSEAHSAQRAYEQLAAGRIDVCLLDVHMPGEDGISLTKRLMRGEGGPLGRVTPVIACTADLLPQTAKLCLSSGMLSVIHKPLKPRLLETSLAYAMRISRRILIADDLEANRIILAHMYRHLGIEVEQAASGTEAIAMLRERPYRYLVLDEHLGDMLGREVVTALRSMEVPWRHMPVISSTATAKADEIEAAYDDLLPKPIELDQLRQLLRRWGPAPQEAAPGT